MNINKEQQKVCLLFAAPDSHLQVASVSKRRLPLANAVYRYLQPPDFLTTF
jgi:hypothetical protein